MAEPVEPLTLTTAIGPYPHALPLKDARVTSPRVVLRHVDIDPVNRAFRPMVNDLVYDVSEMALVTLMLGRDRHRPLRGIPVIMMRQSALRMLQCRLDSPLRGARDLSGKRIGVRAYTQTTGTWVRGILQDQFGVDLGSLRWVTFEPAHVDGFVDPPSCERAADGKTLLEMTLSGEVDASVGLEPHPGLRTVVPDVERAEEEYGLQPVNHVLCVREDLAEKYPWLTAELFEMFSAARACDPSEAAPFGVEPNREAVERLARYAHEQGIVPNTFRAEELLPPPSGRGGVP